MTNTRPSFMTGRRFLIGFLLLALSILAFACAKEAEAPAADVATTAEKPADEIAWFQGSVEEAFALAKQERRPVFLYWGAVWCPPCHALRAKLFTQPEFRARLSSTVAVYLDGDTERAQIWGEKLGTLGYPTVIIFDADGREITRIPGTLPVDQYADVVANALDASRPVTEVLAAVEAGGPAAVPPAELNLLAFYSFDQDQALELGIAKRRELFDRLWRETPEELTVEKARFLVLYATALAQSDEETAAPELSDDARRAIITDLEAILADRSLRNVNLDLVLYRAGGVVEALTPAPGEERDGLVSSWRDAAGAIEADENLSTDDRLTALLPQIELAKLGLEPAGDEEVTVPADLQDHIREKVRWAGEAVRDEDEMQAVMSTMAGVLEEAGLASEAGTLLSERMSETTAPYYYQGWLASIEADAGRTDEAVKLYREAWQGAKISPSGSKMSAFRWGSSYLRQAMKYTPDAAEAIAADADVVLSELLEGPDAFAGGNWSRLSGLGTALQQWEGEDQARAAVVSGIREKVREACDRFPDEGEESGGVRCRSFLSDEGAL